MARRKKRITVSTYSAYDQTVEIQFDPNKDDLCFYGTLGRQTFTAKSASELKAILHHEMQGRLDEQLEWLPVLHLTIRNYQGIQITRERTHIAWSPKEYWLETRNWHRPDQSQPSRYTIIDSFERSGGEFEIKPEGICINHNTFVYQYSEALWESASNASAAIDLVGQKLGLALALSSEDQTAASILGSLADALTSWQHTIVVADSSDGGDA